MHAWRLLQLEANDAFTNMAVDEAIMMARMEGLVPNTLRFYRWKPSAVSVGRFQDVSKEVYTENCRRHSVDVVRRITGGGAVYHDYEHEITYSVIAHEKDFGTADVVSTYNRICDGLIEAAKILGVKADFSLGDPKRCPNITINGRKISGSAQCRRGGALLQHGTFLLEANLERMFTFLRVPWTRTPLDVICVAENKITSLRRELGMAVSMEEAHQALVEGFRKALGVNFQEKVLTSSEQSLAEKLRSEKYATNGWNLQAGKK